MPTESTPELSFAPLLLYLVQILVGKENILVVGSLLGVRLHNI